MISKRLKLGTGYYWNGPSWAIKAGCPMKREALGLDYGEAKRRCDEILNPQFQAWLNRAEVGEISERLVPGTWDWMIAQFKQSTKYGELPPRTQKSYDASLQLVTNYQLKDGRRFGSLNIAGISPETADRLYQKLALKGDGKTKRQRTAHLAMQVCRRAWNVAWRNKPDLVPPQNPFEKMGLKYRPESTRAVSYDEMMRLVGASDEAGLPSIGTACMISFFWLLRQVDCLQLKWGAYRPDGAPLAQIVHHKTGALVDVPLIDVDGTLLFTELTSRLDGMAKRSTFIITRDQPDRCRKIHLPWQPDHFRHAFAVIREAAGLSDTVTFRGLRHGGLTEGADAGLTDAQMRSLSGHRTSAALLRYAQDTNKQRRVGARARLDSRTKKGDLSE